MNAYTPRYQVAAQTFTIPGTPATDWAAGNWTYTTEWTENGKPLEATTTAPVPGGTPTSDTVRYTYSEYGVGLTAGQPGGTTWIDAAAKYVADTEFDVLGRITERVLQRNDETVFVREYGYNPQTGALDVIKGGFTGAGLIQHDQYQRDAIGNVTAITDVTSNTKECFLYDSRNRLERAHTATAATACLPATGDDPLTAGDRGAVPYDLVYAFDDINRLTARTDKLAAAGGVATFTPAANGQRPHAVTEVSTTTGGTSTTDSYAYNAYGAMENRDGETLTWDGQQRLKQYTYGDTNKGVENYEYWTSNQRVQRQAGGTRTIYLPGLDITIQGANRTITKQITIDGAVVATKVLGAQVEVWWNCADMQNSTTCQTQPGNTGTTQHHKYLPYGATRGTNTITTTDRGFLNQPEDTTGLTYLNNRYHDPTLAAFISVDPLVRTTGHPYLYGNGNPVTMSDPSGLCAGTVGMAGREGDWWQNCEVDNGGSPGLKDEPNRRCYQKEENCIRQNRVYNGDHSDGFWTFLAVLGGFIPGVGEIIDLHQCMQGDNLACAMILAPGGAAALRQAREAIQTTDNVTDTIRAADNSTHVVDDAVSAACSFSGDTPVHMADGTRKRIDQVEVGDMVIATDPETGETKAREVIATLPHEDQLVTLTTNVGQIVTTEDHLFWNVTDGEWQSAQDLDSGDQLLAASGLSVIAEGIDWTTLHTTTAYDLDVQGIDTFYVGAGDTDVLVHNCNSWGNPNTLDDHFARHGADFAATSADDYARQASEFYQQPGTLTKIDPKTGVIRVYDPATNTFGSYNPNGTTKTFYKPDPAVHGYPTNLDYWNDQPG